MQTHRYDVLVVGAGAAGLCAALDAGRVARTAVLTKLRPPRPQGPAGGDPLLGSLYRRCVEHEVEFFHEHYALDLLLGEVDGRQQAAGVVAHELASGEVHVFRAKSVVFATGGAGRVFRTTSSAHTLTGDGMGIVLRQGLPLADMELFRFHPTGLAGVGVPLSEAALAQGAILRNRHGEPFMRRHAPSLREGAPGDDIARAMAAEVREGRGAGPHGDHVLLDLTHLERSRLHTVLPDVVASARTHLGIDPHVRAIPVFPTAHHTVGGIPTTTDTRVLRDATHVVPGLYAAGECACVCGLDGGREGTDSLRDAITFGRRAGAAAAGHAARTPWVDLAEHPEAPTVAALDALRDRTGGERVGGVRDALQETMNTNAQALRSASSLDRAAAELRSLRERLGRIALQDRGRRFNSDLVEAVELGFLLELAEVIVQGALRRTESRGGHFREDHPARDDARFPAHAFAYREETADGAVRVRSAEGPSRAAGDAGGPGKDTGVRDTAMVASR